MAEQRAPSLDTGANPVVVFPEGEAVSSSSAARTTRPVRAPRLLPILAIALAAAGAALAVALGARSAAAATLGWALAGPAPAILIVAARRMALERSASSRFEARPLDEPLLRWALAAMLAAALAASLVLGPWLARW